MAASWIDRLHLLRFTTLKFDTACKLSKASANAAKFTPPAFTWSTLTHFNINEFKNLKKNF